MSQENVEIVRRLIVAFNERDADQLVALSDPDCEWVPFRAQLEGITYRGHDGIRRFLLDMDEDWSTFLIDPLQFQEQGERVVVTGQVSAKGRGSGVGIDSVAGFVVELRNNHVRRLMSYSDPAEALEAAGLSE